MAAIRWLGRFVLKTFAQYVVIVIGGLTLFMILSQIAGYVPYSDRPGPGWYALFPGFTVAELWDVTTFATAFAIGLIATSVFYIPPIILLARLLEWLSVPRVVVSILGAAGFGYMTWLIVCGVGWFIAIGLVAVIVATVLGLCFGAWVFQKHEAPGTAQ